ncbi:MAG TPA: iron-sulfur cluster assembly protein, partial [Casimicrobiaceae bacterium]|nr:iron-sulfur cluster assembly protein [Casimicrobiaceae bacterium]
MTTAEQRAIAATAQLADQALRTQLTPDVARAWEALAAVPDPEIPMVSVVELGIVRDVEGGADGVTITVTPTYSGCPATDVIASSIVEAVTAAGFPAPRLVQR